MAPKRYLRTIGAFYLGIGALALIVLELVADSERVGAAIAYAAFFAAVAVAGILFMRTRTTALPKRAPETVSKGIARIALVGTPLVAISLLGSGLLFHAIGEEAGWDVDLGVLSVAIGCGFLSGFGAMYLFGVREDEPPSVRRSSEAAP